MNRNPYPSDAERLDYANPFGDLEAPSAGAILGGRPAPAMDFGGAGAAPGPAYLQDPRLVKPENGVDFIVTGSVNIAGVTPAGTFVQVATFALPNGARGIVRDGSISVAGTITTATDVVFRVVVSGGVVPGWDQLSWAGRAASALDQGFAPEATFIDVPEAANIEIQARVNDAGTYDCFAFFHGWSWRG